MLIDVHREMGIKIETGQLSHRVYKDDGGARTSRRSSLDLEVGDVQDALGDYNISLDNDFNNRKKGDRIKKSRGRGLGYNRDHILSCPTIGPISQHK